MTGQISNFQADLKIQKTHLHREIVKKFLGTYNSIDISSIRFCEKIGLYANTDDDVFLRRNKQLIKIPIEYKTDYKTSSTGNIVIEILGSIDLIYTKDFPLGAIYKNEPQHLKVCKLIEEIKSGNIQASRGMALLDTENIPNYHLFSYLIAKNRYPKNLEKTEDIEDYLIFRTKKLVAFMQNNYQKYSFMVTESQKISKWRTIGCFIKKKDLLPLTIFQMQTTNSNNKR